jgi:glycosyltransferase involved in cell wall biosynthesis
MRIAVDARELLGRPTGVGRYLAELLACWSRQPSAAAHQFLLFADRELNLPEGLIGSGGASIETRVAARDAAASGSAGPDAGRTRGGSGVVWEQMTFPRALRRAAVDVVFGPAYSGPVLTRLPLVITLHDVSFCAHPEWFGAREGRRRRWLAWAAARRARVVLTVSEFSRQEIVRTLGVPAEKIVVTHESAGGWFDSLSQARESPNAETPPQRELLVLHVGSLFNRRHVSALIRAFAALARELPDARLAIVGENRTHPREDPEALARSLGVAERVSIRSYVSDTELASLYRRAAAFAFLSTYEGFGLTPLEALAAGVPIVVYDTPVAREVYADSAIYVREGDVDGVTRALRTLLTDETARAALRARAEALLPRYSWAKTADLTLAALTRAGR